MNMKLLRFLHTIKENASRISLGLVFFALGLNGFFNFFSTPTPSVEAHAFIGGLAAAPYFFPLLKGVEALCGLSLLLGRYVNLALVVLAPIVVHVVLFHAFLDLSVNSLILPAVVVLLYTQLLWKNKKTLSVLAEK